MLTWRPFYLQNFLLCNVLFSVFRILHPIKRYRKNVDSAKKGAKRHRISFFISCQQMWHQSAQQVCHIKVLLQNIMCSFGRNCPQYKQSSTAHIFYYWFQDKWPQLLVKNIQRHKRFSFINSNIRVPAICYPAIFSIDLFW